MEPRLSETAPGVYTVPETSPRTIDPVRLDVCAFVGVAPRGPCRVPDLDVPRWRRERPCVDATFPRLRSVAVPVESFEEYRRLFGGFEGPGRLPYAVASFFEQGGRRAYVVRIVHDYGDARDDAGVARGVLDGFRFDGKPVELVARSEGSWGNGLRAALGLRAAPLVFASANAGGLTFDPDDAIPFGSLVRCRTASGERHLRFVVAARLEHHGDVPVVAVDFDLPLSDVIVSAELIDGILLVDDGDGRRERHEELGLMAGHPRWIGTVLCYESELVWPAGEWAEGTLVPNDAAGVPFDPELPDADDGRFDDGTGNAVIDRYSDLTPDDFFDSKWVLGDEDPASGAHAVARVVDVASVVLPDLYVPEPLDVQDEVEDVSTTGPDFAPCVDVAVSPGGANAVPELSGLYLDPATEQDAIVALQTRVVELAEAVRIVALLDVPPGLRPNQIERWRQRFRSSYAAAYHPWIYVTRTDDDRSARVLANPSAAAAGIIAASEIEFGVPHGPAQRVVRGAIDVTESVGPSEHGRLHGRGINVLVRDRDGVRLTAARTLSRDASVRQLSVRRLMMLLTRTLQREMQWVVFEPNGPRLRSRLRHLLRMFLRRLYDAGAFAGATEAESFFVRCDDSNNPPASGDDGRLVAEIGVAPAEPLEFIVLRLTRASDELSLEEV